MPNLDLIGSKSLTAQTCAERALEHASNLLACINELTLDTALGDGGKHAVWAAHHLGDRAKVIIDEALTTLAKAKGIGG